MDILKTIVAKRRSRIEREGYSLGSPLPDERHVPVVPFGEAPFVICEVKRRSPSKGDISTRLDPVAQVGLYVDAGITSVSILTEEDFFAGSLDDLMQVKKAYPGIAVLRKDFLLSLEDVEISHRVGADAVLLIASVLDQGTLEEMYDRAIELGMTPLVEVHDEEDIIKVRPIRPILTGINSRNLRTFSVDLLHPVSLRTNIEWDTRLVFESGIHGEEDARFAASAGFSSVLVGEAVVKRPDLIPEIVAGVRRRSEKGFWSNLYSRKRAERPLVKICGLTNPGDVALATELGADLLGFIFTESPRRVEPGFIRSLGMPFPGQPGRVGVVVSTDSPDAAEEAFDLLDGGYLDAIQFHGDETPEDCYKMAFPYYKALRPAARADVAAIERYGCPRVLLDAFVRGSRGGTGKRLAPEIVAEAGRHGPIWLAGGLNPDNVADVVEQFGPELIDASSGLEASPGKKDPEKLRRFFRALGGDA